MTLEQDPAAFLHYEAEGYPELPRPGAFRSVEISPEAFVEHHLKSLVEHWHLHFSWFNWIYPLSFQASARLPLPHNPP